MNNDRKKQLGSMSKVKWIRSEFQALPNQECILLEWLLGFLRTILCTRWISKSLETILNKNFRLLVRITKQTVFGLPDELNIRVKDLNETRGH